MGRGREEWVEGFEVFVKGGIEGGYGEMGEEVLLCVKGFVGGCRRGRGRLGGPLTTLLLRGGRHDDARGLLG